MSEIPMQDSRNPAYQKPVEPKLSDLVRCKMCDEYYYRGDLETVVNHTGSDEYEEIEECDYCHSHSECCGAEIIGESRMCSQCGEHC